MATNLNITNCLVAYRDVGNSNYGTTQMIAINEISITDGIKNVFSNTEVQDISVSLINNTSYLVAYYDVGNANYGTAQILTASGTTITAGNKFIFNDAATENISTALIDSTHCMVIYRDAGNNDYGTAQILTINGTTITGGTEFIFNESDTENISVALIDEKNCLVSYRDVGNLNYGTAQILTINGINITSEEELVFNEAETQNICTTKIDGNHCLVTYRDVGNSDYGTAQVLSVYEKTLIAGTEQVFNEAETQNICATLIPLINANYCLVAYRDVGNSDYGTAQILTIDETTVTVGTEFVFNSVETQNICVTLVDSNHCLVAYRDIGNPADATDYGTAQILTINGINITSEEELVFNEAETQNIFLSLISLNDAFITPEIFITLKNDVKTLMNKRNGVGAINQYGTSTYDYTTTPATDVSIAKEHYTKNRTPLNALNSTEMPPDISEEGATAEVLGDNIEFFQDRTAANLTVSRYAQNLSASRSYYMATTDCSSSCTGTCISSCSSQCTTSCTGGCDTTCSGTCSGSCQGGCYTTCSGTCSGDSCATSCSASSGTCTGSCTATCANSCDADNCNNTCTHVCAGTCVGSDCSSACMNDCVSDCTGDCKTTCTGNCSSDGCSTTCMNMCSPTCELNAGLNAG